MSATRGVRFESTALVAADDGAAGAPAAAHNGIAVLILDFQNEFVSPGGRLHGGVKDMLEHTGMVQRLPKLIASARESGALIVHSPVVLPAGEHLKPGDWDPHSYEDLQGLFLAGTWAVEFAAEVAQEEGDVVLRNRTGFDAFQGTGLREILAARGIGALFVGGLLTNLCVEETIRTAGGIDGLGVYGMTDGCAAKTAQEHFTAIAGAFPLFSTPVTCHQAAALMQRMRQEGVGSVNAKAATIVKGSVAHQSPCQGDTEEDKLSPSIHNLEKTVRTLKSEMPSTNGKVQPGRSRESLLMNDLSRSPSTKLNLRKSVVRQRTMEFFGQVKIKHLLINVVLSVAITGFVLYVCPSSWQAQLTEAKASGAIGVMGGLMSFSLVFRAQSCYNRWWEARMQWGMMVAVCQRLAGQARTWFSNEDMVNAFLTQCVLYPYACKAALRGDGLVASPEEDSLEEAAALCRRGSVYLEESPLADTQVGEIMRLGGPYACASIMHRIAYETFAHSDECKLHLLVAMEQAIFELNATYGGCLRIKGTRMPASYTLFLRSFVVVYFASTSLLWAPTLRWLTPIVVSCMVFLINTIIIIGDQMMTPFALQWSALPLEKFCEWTENEIMNVSRQHSQLNVFTSL